MAFISFAAQNRPGLPTTQSRLRAERATDAPRVTPGAKGEELKARRDEPVRERELVAVRLGLVEESEAVELVGARLQRGIVMRAAQGDGDHLALFNDSAVGECEILHRLADHRHCAPMVSSESEGCGRGRTAAETVEALRLAQEAVHTLHALCREFAPPVAREDLMDLLPDRLEVLLRLGCEVVQRVREALQIDVFQSQARDLGFRLDAPAT